MTLAEYMGLCLGHPAYGYYMTRDPFGKAGDFVTAPEVSQMFGEMIGLWIADLWTKLGSPKKFILLECGPGRGTLMDDILRTTKAMPGFHEAAQIYLMEISPVLKDAQKRKLASYDPHWIDDLSQLPASLPVILVGNEFLDALPIRQLQIVDGQWYERVVGITRNDTLGMGLIKADRAMVEAIPPAIRSGVGEGVFEVSPVLNQFIKSVDILLKKQTGAALFLDYGHAHSAPGDTLQAMKDHRFVSIFETPGSADITAHVDFENISRIARADGVRVHGPVTQRDFLRGLGIETRADRLLERATEAQKVDIGTGLKRLIDTEQMGSLFKVVALCHDADIQIAGFHEAV